MAKLRRILSPDGARDGAHIMTARTISTMAVNSTRNWRWYYAAQMPCDRGGNPGQHPIQDGGAVSQSNWYFGVNNCGANIVGNNEWGVQFNFGGNSSPNFRWYLGGIDNLNNFFFQPKLTKGVVYRMEIQLARVSTTQFRVHIWVTDPAGNVVGSDAGIRNEAGVLLSTNPLLNFNVVANTGVLVAGLNGISADNTTIQWPIHHNDQGAFAIVDGLPEGSQIGAYGRVVGEVPR